MSFLKRLFGGSPRAPQPPAAPSTSEFLAQCRAHLGSFDRHTQPKEWAEAARILSNNLVAAAHSDNAIASYTEAAEVLREAIAASDEHVNVDVRALLRKMRGEVLYRHGILLEGDARGHMLADAANLLAEAAGLIQPRHFRELWMEAATFRGAALHELGRMKSGPEGLAWMDDAAACFAEIAEHGSADGPNPIGLYNRYVVLEQRGHRTEGSARHEIYREARTALVRAMATKTFSGNPDMTARLADLDAVIAASD